MVRSRALPQGNLFRRATAQALLVFLFLAPLASERLHNHVGSDDPPIGAAVTGPSLATASGHSVPERTLPCPACLYHRTLSVDSSERAPDARQLAVSLEERVPSAPAPPAAPVVLPTGSRAPPACS